MALKIIGAADGVVEEMHDAILASIPDADVEVKPTGPGHFEIRVVAETFRDKNRVRQHQLVYQAIAPLMAGDAPPVHAIDRLETAIP